MWAFLSDAAEPGCVRPGAIIGAGDSVEPVLSCVIRLDDGPGDDKIVLLGIIGVPDQVVDELRHTGLLA